MIPLLVAVFAVAAVLKALRPAATTGDFRSLGLPRPALAARLVPAAEIGVIGALVAEPLWGSLAALTLLGPFTVFLVIIVRSGRSVSCGCLGAFDRRPVSWHTVGRNVVLMAAALLAAAVPPLRWPAPPGPGLIPAAEAFDGSGLAGAVLVAMPVLLVAAVGTQLFRLRSTMGRLWSVELAGEAARSGRLPDRSPHRSSDQSPDPAPDPAPGPDLTLNLVRRPLPSVGGSNGRNLS